MAGRGNTTPKPDGERRRTNKPPKARQVEHDGEPVGPELPFGVDWPGQTRVWWDNWRRSVPSRTFDATDWDFLLDTALIHASFWLGNTSVGPELRLRVSKLGATEEDRRRMNVAVEDPKPVARETGVRYQHLRVAGD